MPLSGYKTPTGRNELTHFTWSNETLPSYVLSPQPLSWPRVKNEKIPDSTMITVNADHHLRLQAPAGLPQLPNQYHLLQI